MRKLLILMKRIVVLLILSAISGIMSAQGRLENETQYNGDVSISGSTIVQKGTNGYAVAVETTHGIRFNKAIYLGAGTGLMWSFTNVEPFLPLFAEGRYYLGDSDIKPFLSLRLGGQFCLERLENAFIISPSIGLSIHSFYVKFGYQFNAGVTEVIEVITNNYISSNYKFNSINLTLGYSF